MDDVGRYLWYALILILLILIAMLFSASEVAVLSCGESRVRKLAEEGNKQAKALSRLREHPNRFSVYASTSAMLCISCACCLSLYWYAPLTMQLLLAWFGPGSWISPVALLVTFLIGAFIYLTLGHALPKRIAKYHAGRMALFLITPLRLFSFFFRPLTWLPMQTARLIVCLFGHDPAQETGDVTEEEIRLMVDAGNEHGSIERSEREMINNVFEFDDRSVEEIMTHRTDISAVEKSGTVADAVKIAVEDGFSRIPVYEEDLDNIAGVLYAKDMLELIGKPDAMDMPLAPYMRKVLFVPESTRCPMLFRQFKESKVHMAVIVDEYGGTAGIATMEDLLESIVGNIQDEYDQEIEEVQSWTTTFTPLTAALGWKQWKKSSASIWNRMKIPIPWAA